MVKLLAVSAAVLLVVVAVIHAYWGLGRVWPATSESSLANAVLGPGQQRMPSLVLCLLISALLTAAAALVLARVGVVSLPGPQWISRVGVWVVVFVLGARGVGGMVTSLLAAHPQTYHRLDIAAYSPLCLVLAALCGSAALS